MSPDRCLSTLVLIYNILHQFPSRYAFYVHLRQHVRISRMWVPPFRYETSKSRWVLRRFTAFTVDLPSLKRRCTTTQIYAFYAHGEFRGLTMLFHARHAIALFLGIDLNICVFVFRIELHASYKHETFMTWNLSKNLIKFSSYSTLNTILLYYNDQSFNASWP